MKDQKKGLLAARGLVRLLSVVCLLALLFCAVGCSDQVLGVDTEAATRKPADPSHGEELTIYFETEPETGFIIGGDDPLDLFMGAEHLMRAEFLDTGKSDCLLLRHDETVILVDAADADDYSRISQKLMSYGIETIDYFIITHYDNDHIGSAAQVLSNFTVKTVYMPDYVRDSSLYRRMMSMLDVTDGVTVHRPTEDIRIDLPYGSLWINPTKIYEPGVTLGSDDAHSLEENNYSLITSIYFGDVSLLLAGDAEQDRITEFMETEGVKLTYDVIKIPHHGGYDKALGNLLRENSGLRYCMVHAGNEGLVEASLVTAMRTSGAAAKFTYDGDIAFATDGTSMTVNQN